MAASLFFFTVIFTIIILLITSYYVVYLTLKHDKKMVTESIFLCYQSVLFFQVFLLNIIPIFL